MAIPAETVIEGLEPYEIIFGEDQEGVEPLHTLRKPDGCTISRWKPTVAERHALTFGADILVFQHTCFHPPMPLNVQVLDCTVDCETTKTYLGLDVELNHRIVSGQGNQEACMRISSREEQIIARPTKFPSAQEYYNATEALMTEWKTRDQSQAEMDFNEFQVAEIVRLRGLLLQTLKTL